MKICLGFCLLGLVMMCCGCHKPTAEQDENAQVRWEYADFIYHDPDFKTSAGNATFCFVEFSQGNGDWVGSNNLYSVTSALNSIGDYGWDLAWTDGRHFIVKRPAGVFKNGRFVIAETIVPTK